MNGELSDKVVGILGGMGPESTAHFFLQIVKNTPVKTDQEHLRIIIDNNPKIPDRTLALLGTGKNPIEEAKKGINNLEKAGAEIIALPCNTMHYYYSELQNSTNVPIINMISETVLFIRSSYPNIKKIGLLATTGTIKTRIYHELMKDIELITPNEDEQKKVMNAIYGERGIKAGNTEGGPHSEVLEILQALIRKGAEVIIIGCTELSLLSLQEDTSIPLVDPLNILTKIVVKKARLEI